MLGRVTLQQLHNGGVYRVGIQNVIQEIDRLNGPPWPVGPIQAIISFPVCPHPRPVHVQ